MKNIIKVLIVFVFCVNGFSQNISGEVQYTQTIDNGISFVKHFKMIFNNKTSYSEEVNVKNISSKLKKKKYEKGVTKYLTVGRKNLTPTFRYKNNEKFYFSEIWDNEVLVVKENKIFWDWKLHEETKKIGNFTCQKATTNFRGRNYTAWFTNEIPVFFGPWKFNELSGLILEVYDVDRIFHAIATKIKISKEKECIINFDKTQLDKALTITQYLKRVDEVITGHFAKLSSKLPKGSKPIKIDKNCKDCSKSLEIFDEKN